MVIESLENKKVKELKKLKQKKYRDKTKTYLIEGIHLVNEANKVGNLLELILLEEEKVDINVKTTYVTKEVLKSISELDTPYNVIGLCKYKDENNDIGKKILILDGIQDPGNLGTIIRSSLAFNVDTIMLSKSTVDLYNSKVLRGAQGMHFHINIIRCDLIEEVKKLKDLGYKIYGTNVNNGIDIKNVKDLEKCAIIMGNEGAGMSKESENLCDESIYIDMNKSCESLNVAVATSIILYELNK